MKRRYPIGAELGEENGKRGVSFRVWAPECKQVKVVLESSSRAQGELQLTSEADGYFAGFYEGAIAGDHYRFALDTAVGHLADPASRFQPNGPHGDSEIIDPASFQWTDDGWKGISSEGQILYELHAGTFTEGGTWRAAVEQLAELAHLGITAIEVMPVADFPGRFGWGYDGVGLFAPTWLYGRPEDFKNFINQAHLHGLGVILDVVYNHFGPDGNYLDSFAKSYFTDKYKNDWGKAINFDGSDAKAVREFFLTNARYWIEEFHLDGLRLDATQAIHDDSTPHILSEIVDTVRAAANGRNTFIVGENEPQQVGLIKPKEQGGFGLDGLWNDDLHHTAIVALTGRNQAYYTDYKGTPQEFVSAAKYGFLYQGQFYKWQNQPRGEAMLNGNTCSFVTFLENHDQVANSGRGERLHELCHPGKYRALTTHLLLAPGTPMLFQGQEFCSTVPFLYFADHQPALSKQVREGRIEFLSQFPSLSDPAIIAALADPGSPSTFQHCKLDFRQRDTNQRSYVLHKDLIRLRSRNEVLQYVLRCGRVDGAVLSEYSYLLRYFGEERGDGLLLVNLGLELDLSPAPEPLLAHPARAKWRVLFSSEDPKYGGLGAVHPETEKGWHLAAFSAVFLAS